MSASDVEDFYVHSATVETKGPRTPAGQKYSAPVTVMVFAKVGVKQIRDTNGDLVVSTSRCSTLPEKFGLFTPGSKVTIAGRPPALVITGTLATSGDMDLPDHCTVYLT